jgi:hypothetical protein
MRYEDGVDVFGSATGSPASGLSSRTISDSRVLPGITPDLGTRTALVPKESLPLGWIAGVVSPVAATLAFRAREERARRKPWLLSFVRRGTVQGVPRPVRGTRIRGKAAGHNPENLHALATHACRGRSPGLSRTRSSGRLHRPARRPFRQSQGHRADLVRLGRDPATRGSSVRQPGQRPSRHSRSPRAGPLEPSHSC